jgi:hypothetical protein
MSAARFEDHVRLQPKNRHSCPAIHPGRKHRMTRKVAIITGSGSGIGAASAVQLAQRGWNIVVN